MNPTESHPPIREVYNHCEQLTEELFFALKFKFQQLLAPYPQEQKRRSYNQALLHLLWKINGGDPKSLAASLIWPTGHQKALELEERFLALCDEYHAFFHR